MTLIIVIVTDFLMSQYIMINAFLYFSLDLEMKYIYNVSGNFDLPSF